MKNGPLDVAICPGCGKVYTRSAMAAMLLKTREHWPFCECGYGFEWDRRDCDDYRNLYRLPTIAELLEGKGGDGNRLYSDVDLALYTRAIVTILTQDKEPVHEPTSNPR